MVTQVGCVRRFHVFSLLLALLFAGVAVPRLASAANWWSENFEVHGFLTSKAYFRTPNFSRQIEV